MASFKSLSMAAIAVLLLTMAVLVTMAVINQYGYSLRTDTTASYNEITVAANNSLTNFGSTYPFVQDVTSCVNSTNAAIKLTEGNYTVVEGTGANGGFVLKDGAAKFSGKKVNCTVSYKASNDISTQANTFKTGLAIFGTFAGVVILALIGKFIIKLFNEK